MNEQLGISGKTYSPLNSFTVANTLKQASLGRLVDGKVAHLRVLVKSISETGNSTSALLKDPTGEISGSIHRKLVEQHGSALSAGSVLILKRATVFSPTGHRHYLNVTPANVVRLYPAKIAQATLASIDKALLEGILDSLGENLSTQDSITSLLDGLNDDDFN
ncbi:homologous recombination OB-fold protein-like [Oscarella lobularis]|uniref:homologous recombination OB-fold protein-like n=1 Tax=Oscarella lobularis TaxID=121494 RepID=UPI0033141D6C